MNSHFPVLLPISVLMIAVLFKLALRELIDSPLLPSFHEVEFLFPVDPPCLGENDLVVLKL